MANIKVYEKNKLDLDFSAVTLSVTDNVADDSGDDFVDQLRDRSNFTGWGTTGSTDAALTRIDIDTIDSYEIDTIILVNMNFKAYTLQYWNGSAFVDFSTPINETNNEASTKMHTFANPDAHIFRLTIQGVMIVDADKLMSQLIFTRLIGEFSDQPEITKMEFDTNRKATRLVSGKRHVSQKANSLNVTMQFPPNKTQNDIDLIKDIFESFEGRLISFIGVDDVNLPVVVQGFQNKDLFLMTPTNNLDTAWEQGFFDFGQVNRIDLVEAR